MAANPYLSPRASCQRIYREPTRSGWADLGIACASVLPLLFVWDSISRKLRIPLLTEGGFAYELTLVVVLLAISGTAVTLGIRGLRSSRRLMALLAIVVGMLEIAMIYYIKLHPWIMRDLIG